MSVSLSISVYVSVFVSVSVRDGVCRATRVEQVTGRHDAIAMTVFKAARSAAAEKSIQKRNTPPVVVEALMMLKTTASWNS